MTKGRYIRLKAKKSMGMTKEHHLQKLGSLHLIEREWIYT